MLQALLNAPEYMQYRIFNNLPDFDRVLSQITRHTTHSAMLDILEKIGVRVHFEHLANNLLDDEAILSNQPEGAATKILAKEMTRLQLWR
ncbi:hypothetical protein QR676_19815 [Vibrio sp. TMPB1044]|uniref:hypothetical protein n=1 Tax=Vibrio sp. TMPB1044 TaxID=3051822 RepID=UPI00255BBD0F|nr:hypothetical protein [Vibrio sp. TMPB1044]MDL5029489.1 hypothetical protein [Vibrio sp. TMPB1044]MDN5209617.1 hypothetical protein [Vibrio sp. TMPB1044]